MNVIERIKKKLKAPWKKYYTKSEMKVDIPDISIYQLLEQKCLEYSDKIAINYFGHTITYKEFLKQIEDAAKAFRSQGIRKGDVVKRN